PSSSQWCFPKNCVADVTLTVIVLPSRSTIVNEPSAPSAPQVSASLTPFTDVTSPNTPWCSPSSGSSVFGGTMNTAAAATVESVTSPLANARRPTHTSANDASVTSLAANSVAGSTLTVNVSPL